MELIAYIFYLLASSSVLVFIGAIFLCIGSVVVALPVVTAGLAGTSAVGRPRTASKIILRSLINFAAVAVVIFSFFFAIFALANLVIPHSFDGPLINSYGQKTHAKVVSREDTNSLHNEEPVVRYNVIYKTADGKNIETYFETWDFNIYPAANTVRYPTVGETFRVAYLPSFPKAFLILTEEDSEYSRGQECGKVLAELEEARIKLEFDPADQNYKKAFEDATKKVANAKCGTTKTEIKTTETRELPARTQ